MTDALAVADRFFRAIEAGDLGAIDSLYADDAVIWHNFDAVVQSKADSLKTLAWMIKTIPQRTYRVLRRDAIAGGFLQQHVLELGRGGAQFSMPACIVAQVQAGKIVRLDEYLDSVHIKDMRVSLAL